LRTAGAKHLIFQHEAAIFVHAYSRGIPRVVNLLCEHSLTNARTDGSRVVSPQCVERAARDCQLDQVDSVSRALNSRYPAGAALGDIGSIFAGMSLSDGAYSSGLTEPPPSEVHVQMRDFSPGEAVTVSDAMVTENPSVFAPILRKADIGQSKPSSADAVQTRASIPASPLRNPEWHARFTRATLFQAWWRSFSVDAHSTWRQLRRLLRAQVLKVRPYARDLR
jgi:hypothetical protein